MHNVIQKCNLWLTTTLLVCMQYLQRSSACWSIINSSNIAKTSFASRSRVQQPPASLSRRIFSVSIDSAHNGIHSMPPPQNNLVVILTGPTAIGKSSIATKLVSSLNNNKAMIVSADSVQVYKHVSIGANKPSASEQLETPHLLVDVVDLQHAHDNDENVTTSNNTSCSSYNAAEWQQDALQCIYELLDLPLPLDDDYHYYHNSSIVHSTIPQTNARTSMIHQSIQAALALKQWTPPVTPILTGGTMMYLQWLVEGRPDAVPCTRAALERAKRTLWQLQQQQQQQPQESSCPQNWRQTIQTVSAQLGEPFATQAAKLSEHDWYRLRRILEVAYTLQEEEEKRESNQQRHQQQGQSATATPSAVTLSSPKVFSGQRHGGLLSNDQLDVRCFFLCPADRQAHARIVDDRCEQMLQTGLLSETAELATKTAALPDMIQKAIGYRQALEYLGRDNPVDHDVAAMDALLHEFQGATRRYSKRQTQWFRKDSNYYFVPVHVGTDDDTATAIAVQTATTREVLRLVQLPRAEFDRERLAVDSVSQITRQNSQAQAKTMRTYLSTRTRLLPNSTALQTLLQQADVCTRQFRETQTYREMQSTKRKNC